MVRALWNGAVIAESDDTVIVEGNHYFPADAVHQEFLVPSTTTTVCPWKGRASYYSLEVAGRVNRDAAWYYPSASTAASTIEGRVAFWRGVTIEGAGPAGRRRTVFDRFRRSGRDAEPAPRAGHTSAVSDVGETDFFATLDGHVTVADFWAPWCGPCKTLHPRFDAQAAEHAGDGLRFVRVNVDTSPGVATALGIMSIPTIIVFAADGHEIDREIGVPDRRRLERMIHAAAALAAASSEGAA